MAYIDTRGRPSKTSIGGAIAINGLMIAGIVFAAPDILPPPLQPPTTIIDIFKPKPVTPIERQKPIEHPHNTTPATPPRSNPGPVTPASGNDLTTTTSGGSVGPVGTGIGTSGIEDPPIKIEPVFKGAQLNPRYADALQPVYPPGLIRAEIEGVVTLRVLVGTDGRVKQVEAVRSDNDAFLETTRRQALGKWRFLPATRDGVPVESWREMTVRFRLPD